MPVLVPVSQLTNAVMSSSMLGEHAWQSPEREPQDSGIEAKNTFSESKPWIDDRPNGEISKLVKAKTSHVFERGGDPPCPDAAC